MDYYLLWCMLNDVFVIGLISGTCNMLGLLLGTTRKFHRICIFLAVDLHLDLGLYTRLMLKAKSLRSTRVYIVLYYIHWSCRYDTSSHPIKLRTT